MSSEIQDSFTTPVGRLVSGNAGEAYKKTDPVTKQVKLGQDGQPIMQYYIAVAIPKGQEPHWGHTEWGAKIWATGHGSFPGGQAQQPTFAWKIIDGDSQVPNKAGKKPVDQVGYPGNWVVSFSTAFAPALWNRDGTAQIAPAEIYRGSYVQIHAVVRGNGQQANPGVFLNHDMIALAGHGDHINVGPDVSEAGFGNAALPQGASATPIGGIAESALAVPPVANEPAQVSAPAAPVVNPSTSAPPVVDTNVPAQAHTQILTPPPPIQG